jgi:siroheme synthase-like protein
MALYPLFLKLAGRKVLVVGGGPVALGKVRALVEAGAEVAVVAPEVVPELGALAEKGNISLDRRSFETKDLGGCWLVVAASQPVVNK